MRLAAIVLAVGAVFWFVLAGILVPDLVEAARGQLANPPVPLAAIRAQRVFEQIVWYASAGALAVAGAAAAWWRSRRP